ncbi:MAG: phage tail assembly protein T [Phycisphaerae bacterium]
MTVRRMLSEMDSRELTEWIAFHSLEPIGYARGDVQAAIVAHTIACAGGANVGLDDFIPDWGDKPEESEDERDERIAAAVRAAFSGFTT